MYILIITLYNNSNIYDNSTAQLVPYNTLDTLYCIVTMLYYGMYLHAYTSQEDKKLVLVN